ncbi:MAG: NmrA family NAD(P)-binding protein [Carboxylicivirga sp.]|jgi:uncharacterized protein YbjT (DUF2867 family)|nr:NmrA family NAD(P)-binding protein [Carboxylicivirga sp.]MCT4624224.1 NmrA family NAD(P)-binding protein [Schleiferiaceae bacterium]
MKAKVLVVGCTGQTGRIIVEKLLANNQVDIRYCSRRQEQVDEWQAEGKEAVLLDLNEPRTFGIALAGIDRLFILTGYTVDMLLQTKTLTDAAVKANVSHIVHWGIFANWDCTEGHFAWHQLVETYIKASGIAWTNLHPNYFMENLINVTPIVDNKFVMFSGKARWGWTSLDDAASVAATVLEEGEKKHNGKSYWLSTEALNGDEAAEILSEELECKITCDIREPEELETLFNSGNTDVEITYAKNAVDIMRQIQDGRMTYMGTIRDDVPYVTGKASTTFREWVRQHKAELLPV